MLKTILRGPILHPGTPRCRAPNDEARPAMSHGLASIRRSILGGGVPGSTTNRSTMTQQRLALALVAAVAAFGRNQNSKETTHSGASAASKSASAAEPPTSEVAIKVADKPLEKVKIVSAVASDKEINLVIDCEVDCDVFEEAYTPGIAPIHKF